MAKKPRSAPPSKTVHPIRSSKIKHLAGIATATPFKLNKHTQEFEASVLRYIEPEAAR
ncbi:MULTISPECIES: hypothetical protein [Bradyrhizobium]|jgi:hypothetical protein|uniref:Uncharacterized protein n=1 Tax=Bradyrhizobium elkanii TaxID=29448 RepID=A0ABV4ER55_BRAEL|nr:MULTISPECIES: hypothetical protein [Bradyrhizobium]MCA1398975.1 hypothetical protein [Bradyrhizobium sp. BRP56]MCP1758596.1 hypothetical protein [Bradyrhizobium elkanii]MCP1975910.1 hypothetical protein [Bradyrhizobium elkanii]MCP1984790.1 hypothetical protein [Bradyrhizobium elkanii]MCS3695152.1 hypothetical protein [Bradyrhizobium elkanii]